MGEKAKKRDLRSNFEIKDPLKTEVGKKAVFYPCWKIQSRGNVSEESISDLVVMAARRAGEGEEGRLPCNKMFILINH